MLAIADSISRDGAPRTAPPISLAELLGALSHALDLTEGQPPGHCMRASWIGRCIGRELGLTESQLGELHFSILLKDLGCSSNAARICQLYLTDDLSFKRDFKRVGERLHHVLGFVMSHTGLKAPLAERFRAILNIVQNGGEIAHELIDTRCQRGAEIARRLRFPEGVATAIASLDEHWNGSGKPQGLAGEAIPVYARIALLAQIVDVFNTAGGRAAAALEASRRSGTWFDPHVLAAFDRASAQASFWEGLASDQAPNLSDELASYGDAVDDDYLDDIAAAFAQVIDSKSPFTRGHSDRVALYADRIAEGLGLGSERRRWLKRAALLHDIGKLGVSNSILDKPGRLDDDEWRAMRQHAIFSETILSRLSAFRDVAKVGGRHHERLDGKGYPRGLSADEIDLDTRMVTVADVFDALTADRPYRSAMPVERALDIMRADLGTALDADCFAALCLSLNKSIEGVASGRARLNEELQPEKLS